MFVDMPGMWSSSAWRLSLGEVERTKRYVLQRVVFKLITTITSVVVLIVRYTLLTITLLMNVRTARWNVGSHRHLFQDLQPCQLSPPRV